jgi:hypothetical protein
MVKQFDPQNRVLSSLIDRIREFTRNVKEWKLKRCSNYLVDLRDAFIREYDNALAVHYEF